MNKKIKRNDFGGFLSNSSIHIILIVWGIIQVFPVIWLFYSSFKTTPEINRSILALPKSFYFGNYNLKILETQNAYVLTYFKNSLIVTIITLILITAVSVLAAYAIAKVKFPGKNLVVLLMIGIMGIPIHSLMIPLYYLMAEFKLVNNYFGLILPYVAFFSPFSIIMLQAYFREFPDEIIDAAKIDGCNHVQTLRLVVMPVSMGAISTILVFNFIEIWNEFLFSLVMMKKNTAKTLPVGLESFIGKYTTDWGPMFAALVISIIPVIIFYVFFHKNIIKGLYAGSIKE